MTPSRRPVLVDPEIVLEPGDEARHVFFKLLVRFPKLVSHTPQHIDHHQCLLWVVRRQHLLDLSVVTNLRLQRFTGLSGREMVYMMLLREGGHTSGCLVSTSVPSAEKISAVPSALIL